MSPHAGFWMLRTDGATAWWDGEYLGMKELKTYRYQKKATVVISDGEDKTTTAGTRSQN
jgi:hypothetical protein